MIGTPNADCTHKQVTHVHGTRTCYVLDKCRCDDCREENRRLHAERRRAQIYGRYDRFVDAEPVRQHIRLLMARGMGIKTIAKAAEVNGGVMCGILYGYGTPGTPGYRPQRKRLTREVAGRLLAVKLELADGALVDATGTRRRLQALVAVGWPQSVLSDHMGWSGGNLAPLILGHRTRILEATRQRVAEIYEQLWDQQPTGCTPMGAGRARRRAARLGWAPPMAWDDETIDDPTAHPDGALRPGESPRRSTAEEAAWLAEQGYADQDIAQILGIRLNSVQQHRFRRQRAADNSWQAVVMPIRQGRSEGDIGDYARTCSKHWQDLAS